jgi:hypothetical protein
MDDDSIGEITAQAKDSSGNLNHGQFISFDNLTTALSNDVPPQIGTGHSLELDGVNDYVRFPSINAPLIEIGTDDYTWNGWLKFDTFTGSYRQIWNNSAGGGAIGFGVLLANSSNIMRLEVYGTLNGRQVRLVNITNYLNVWCYWSFVIVQSTFQILVYSNSILVETLQYLDWGSINKNTGQTPTIGSYTGTTYYYNGLIGSIQIYKNKALSPQEIQQNYNTTKTRYGL